jgi:hypothetical protein
VIFAVLPTAAVVLATAAAAPTRPPAGGPFISLSATPAHMTLLGGVRQTLLVRNDGASSVRLLAARTAFAFDLYGNASVAPRQIPPRSAHAWLAVSPKHLTLAPGREGALRVVAHPPRGASPGDHQALVLLSASARGGARVAVRARIGVLVLVRVPGRIVRQVVVGRVWARHAHTIAVTAVNRGNVAERLLPGQVTVSLRRGHRIVEVVRGTARDLLPRSRGILVMRCRTLLRRSVTAVVHIAAQPGWKVGQSAPALPSTRRTLRLR